MNLGALYTNTDSYRRRRRSSGPHFRRRPSSPSSSDPRSRHRRRESSGSGPLAVHWHSRILRFSPLGAYREGKIC